MKAKRYILWDHDGVLVDTEYWYYSATRKALAELGIELERDLYMQRMVRGESSWELALAEGIAEELVLAKRRDRDRYYQQYLSTQDIEIDGVNEVLEELSGRFGMAVVTTSKGADFELIHRERNIVTHMDFVLVREDYRASKPDPEPYLLAMQRFGTRPEECLVVEDSQRGLQAALAAGIDCAIVYNKFTSGHDFSGARYRLQDIRELPGIIDA